MCLAGTSEELAAGDSMPDKGLAKILPLCVPPLTSFC